MFYLICELVPATNSTPLLLSLLARFFVPDCIPQGSLRPIYFAVTPLRRGGISCASLSVFQGNLFRSLGIGVRMLTIAHLSASLEL